MFQKKDQIYIGYAYQLVMFFFVSKNGYFGESESETEES